MNVFVRHMVGLLSLTFGVVACVQPSSSISDLVNAALQGSHTRVFSLEISPQATKLRLSGVFNEELQSRVITAIEPHLLGKTKALEFEWELKNSAQLQPQAYCSGAARVVYPNPRVKPSSITGAKIMLSPGHGLTQLVSGAWVYQRPIPPSLGAFLHEDPNNLEMSIPISAALVNAGAVVSSSRNLDVLAGVGLSGIEKWKEASRHHVQALGVPDHVWNSEGNDLEGDCNKGRDIRVRPFYANYLGVDALLGLHSNADSSSSARGLRIYYNTEAFTPDIPNTSLVQSADLAEKLTNSILAAIQQDHPELGWSATLPIGSNQYGETGYAKMPSVLIEVGFHTNSTDAAAMQEATFRSALARGIENGLEQFFGAAIPTPSVPTGLTAAMSSNGRMFLAWNEVSSANDYGFFASLNGQPLTISQTVPKGYQPQAAAVAAFEHNPNNPALVGQSVCFAIRASNTSGSSGLSSSACVPYAYYLSASLQQEVKHLPSFVIRIPWYEKTR